MTVQPTKQQKNVERGTWNVESRPGERTPNAAATCLSTAAAPSRGARPVEGANIPAMLAAWARIAPRNFAVTHCCISISYHELNHYSNQLANYLGDIGVEPSGFVALYLDRSIEMVVAMLGAMKAGCAYVPIDPACPADRIALIAGDSGANVLLTHESLSTRLPSPSVRTICIDTDWPRIAHSSGDNAPVLSFPSDFAFVIYTSETTGTPKGVKITHANVANLLN